MRIEYFSGAYVPSREANSMHVMRMSQAMARLGHDVTLDVRPGEKLVKDDFSHYGVAPCFRIVKQERPQVRVWGAVVNASRVARGFAQRQKPDLVYARDYWALALVADSGIPFVFESHWEPKSAMHKAIEGWLMRKPGFKRLVLISEELRKVYAAAFPWISPEKVVVAHDAADPVPLDGPVHQEIASAPGALRVGYVGSFWPGYGIDVVVRLADAMPDLSFHVVGGGADEVSVWKARTSVIKNLTFHGFVEPGKLGEVYRAFDVLLAPYQVNTPHIRWISPMKLFEYMAHGKAIVCSEFPVMREIIENYSNGLLVEAADSDAWIKALDRLREPALRARLASAARQKLETAYTWRRRAERVLSGI
jgi:glycosyltransferase involved in cell wall biosynthesis